MAHCPECGSPTPPASSVCPSCGRAVPGAKAAPVAARTIVGVAASDVLPAALTRAAGTPKSADEPPPAAKTIVGLPARSLASMQAQPQPQQPPPSSSAAMAPSSRTLLGVAKAGLGVSPASSSAPVAGADPTSRTLLGVARPGIAPLAPGVASPDDEEEVEEEIVVGGGELGATLGPNGAWAPPVSSRQPAPQPTERRTAKRVRKVAAQQPPEKTPRRTLAIMITAGVLAVAAVLFAVFWGSPPPLEARARADAEGHDAVEVRCKSCPNGTKIMIGDASAAMVDHVAVVPQTAALSVGENKLKIQVERPKGGRAESVMVTVNVAYRVRPDLGTLQGERPAIQIVAEAAKGVSVIVDSRPMAFDGGRAVETVDVSSDVTGLTDETKQLTKKIAYTVTPADGPAETGVVNVSVGIVPLSIEAPGSRVTIDGSSFVLAGRTMKGAEVLAAGRPIAVRPDGTFAQEMNVSAVGATQIEVRARMPGMAPRITQIGVRRVDSFDVAAREFAAQNPVPYATVADAPAASAGKATVVGGEVADVRQQGFTTIMLLDVDSSFGCKSKDACRVRLVQGAKVKTKAGDKIRAFGVVSRAFGIEGHGTIPEIQVDFTLKGLK